MLELTMATVAGADAGATAGMAMADAPSEPGAVLRVGRDASVCRLVTPDDWLFVSRVHLEFRCGPHGEWSVFWLRGSQADPSSEVRVRSGVQGGPGQPLSYGGALELPRGGSGEVIVLDRSGPRSVNVGFYHEA
ncbi:FHA domain-containing protein [Streptomyces sp. VRA16 Mangrove soil]|uniref:FHA domain-containing protein n=1 Tax=Streptomyces sp. VRA16 Mangrove soil TaxID=2817434 RepID=UPI001A9D01C0|nr:FHA domain-containing protein [Streptomyces sp. VRA16 Mangrove soil]MBO1333110.1 FHA domain-containing protein [Streptomyces sp. VRA16 Mangrove soil]